MFDPIKEVPSLELCKKLKELNYPQDGGGWYLIKERDGWKLKYYSKPFSYCPYLTIEDWCSYELDFDKDGFATGKAKYCKFENKFKECSIFQKNVIKAPTVRELGEWLPDFTSSFKEQTWWECHTNIWLKKGKEHHIEVDNTEANARAKMLIWLIENGYVSFKK